MLQCHEQNYSFSTLKKTLDGNIENEHIEEVSGIYVLKF